MYFILLNPFLMKYSFMWSNGLVLSTINPSSIKTKELRFYLNADIQGKFFMHSELW